MKKLILFFSLLRIGILDAQFATIGASTQVDENYKKEKLEIRKVFKPSLSAEKSIFIVDSLLSSGSFKSKQIISELHAMKARLLLEKHKETLDSLLFQNEYSGVRRTSEDTSGNYIFQAILRQWEIALAVFPNPSYRIDRYESILNEYGIDEKFEGRELDTLKLLGYRSKFSSLLFSTGLRVSDKNLWLILETSLRKGSVQPHYRLKTPGGNKYKASRYTENMILSAEMNNSFLSGFSFSPARINSFIMVEPIRVGIKKSWESDTWRMFLRPSLGLTYGYFSIAYACTIYLRKSESISNDIHYLQLRFTYPFLRSK